MTQRAQNCQTMTELRQLIDELDAELIARFSDRWACIKRAAELKKQEGLPARIDSRVEEVAHNVNTLAQRAGLDAGLYEDLWRQLMEHAIAYEKGKLGEPDK